MSEWRISYFLPNVSLIEPIEHPEWKCVAIVPSSDKRVIALQERNHKLKQFLEKFRNELDSALDPALLIFSPNCSDEATLQECHIDLRSVLAFSVLSNGWVRRLIGQQWGPVLWSDYFRFSPWWLDTDGFAVRNTLSVRGVESVDVIKYISGYPGLHPRSADGFETDVFLFEYLLNAWRERYMHSDEPRKHTQLFRSLQMAFQAAAQFDSNDASIYDAGISLSLWISAFECFHHPGKGGTVGWKDIVEILGDISFQNPRLVDRRKWADSDEEEFTFAQRLCKSAYDTRNSFMHGNPVCRENLMFLGGTFSQIGMHPFLLLLFRALILHKSNAFDDPRLEASLESCTRDVKLTHFELIFNNALEKCIPEEGS